MGTGTVYAAVEALIAHLAGKVAKAGFLVNLAGDRLLMVTEKTVECSSQWLGLNEQCVSIALLPSAMVKF